MSGLKPVQGWHMAGRTKVDNEDGGRQTAEVTIRMPAGSTEYG